MRLFSFEVEIFISEFEINIINVNGNFSDKNFLK